MGQDENEEEEEDQRRRKRGRIEWVIAGVSGLIVAAMIAFVLYEALNATSSNPLIEVSAQSVEQTQFGYHVAFRAENHGDATAADVPIEGTLESDGQVVETVTVTVDYIPANSERKGGLNFARDPSGYQLRLRATGYNDP